MPYLLKYTIKRVLLMLLSTFIILTITFFLMKLLPDPPISGTIVAQNAYCQDQVSQGYYLVFNSEQTGLGRTIIPPYTDPTGMTFFYYRRPIIEQYFAWLRGIFTRWDWGTSSSIQRQTGAIELIGARLVPTISINVFALIISLPLGFIFGIIAALNKNKPTDHIISTIVMIFISVPSFVIISLLMLGLSYSTGWLPSSWPINGSPISAYAQAMVIPVLSLCFGTIAAFTRYTRAELCEVMSSEFLLLARTKGLNKRQCVIRHALRNSLVPLVPMIIGQFIGILGGSVVLEQLYGIQGIGRLFVEAIKGSDYNVLLADMAIFTMISLAASLLVDLSYGIVDPRIRMGAKAS